MIRKHLVPAIAAVAATVGTVSTPLAAAGDAHDTAVPARTRSVTVVVAPYDGNPPGPCTTHCDSIRVRITGFRAQTTYQYRTNIIASDGSGAVSGSITTNRQGRASRYVAYYDRTVYDETYCVTVKRRRGCADGR